MAQETTPYDSHDLLMDEVPRRGWGVTFWSDGASEHLHGC